MIELEFKAFLDSLGTLGDIRVGAMDATPDVLGCIYNYGGQPPEYGFGVVGVKYDKPALQLMFRGEPHDYSGPMGKAVIAYYALAAIQPGAPGHYTWTTAEVLTVAPQSFPRSLGRDKNNRFEIVVNCYIEKTPS